MRRNTTTAGVTLVELLIVISILTLILGLLVTFFQAQIKMARLTSARTEVQDRVRFVMAGAAQDLQLTGANRYIDSANNVSTLAAFGVCTVTACLTGTDNTVTDTMKMRYITSLRPMGEACRNISWSVTSKTINRSDVACGTAESAQGFADDILAFNIRYVCSDTAELDVPTCTGARFTRSARVTIYAQSTQITPSVSASSFDVEGTSVSCPENRVCFGLQQEIQMPNMKDK